MARPSRVYLKDISSKPKALKNQEIFKGEAERSAPPFLRPAGKCVQLYVQNAFREQGLKLQMCNCEKCNLVGMIYL